MKQTQRHNGIIELVKQQGYVSTEELVEHFSVSPQTIRRDLNELAEQNLILRHHGGAALPSSSVNTPWHDRKATQTEEKERIARKVAEQIPWLDAVYRYRHHAGSGSARTAQSQQFAHCHQQSQRC